MNLDELHALDQDGTCDGPDTSSLTSGCSTLPVGPNLTALLDYDEAIISACAKENATEEEKEEALSTLSSHNMRPVLLRNSRGESYALAHESTINDVSSPDLSVVTVVPHSAKRKRSRMSQAQPEIIRSLKGLLSTSPYAEILKRRRFIELDSDVAEILNYDWVAKPHFRYACAQLLAGCILLNTKNGHATIVNTVEVYGRKKSTDIHCEPYHIIDSHPIQTSIPPKHARYTDVWPMTMDPGGNEKLVIGTQSFHAHITSSFRLDSTLPASIGDMAPTFQLTERLDSRSTRIYLDWESIELGLGILKNKNARRVTKENALWQLRNIKSNFHDPCTYYLSRASSYFAQDHMCQPFTLFNIGTFDQSDSGYEKVGAELLENISTQVLSKGSMACLDKSTVSRLLSRCERKSHISYILLSILELFTDDNLKIRILANSDLNALLEDLAALLVPFVNSVNEIVVGFVSAEFSV